MTGSKPRTSGIGSDRKRPLCQLSHNHCPNISSELNRVYFEPLYQFQRHFQVYLILLHRYHTCDFTSYSSFT